MNPPVIIVIGGCCESIPFHEWHLVEELVNLIPDHFIGHHQEQQLHVNLKWDSAQLLALLGAFQAIFSMFMA